MIEQIVEQLGLEPRQDLTIPECIKSRFGRTGEQGGPSCKLELRLAD